MKVEDFQRLIHDIYGRKDAGRGAAWTFAWFVEEVGELGAALRNQDAVATTGHPESRKLKTAEDVRRNLEEEFADVFAWLVSLATIAGVNLTDAAGNRYGTGCPYCRQIPCGCVPAHAAPADSTPPAASSD